MEHYKSQFAQILSDLKLSKTKSEVDSNICLFKQQLQCYLNYSQATDLSDLQMLYEESAVLIADGAEKIWAHYKLTSVDFNSSLAKLNSQVRNIGWMTTPKSRSDSVWTLLFGQRQVRREINSLINGIFDFCLTCACKKCFLINADFYSALIYNGVHCMLSQ